MKNFRTYDVAMEFYRKCQSLHISNKVIKDQFERASLSIVLNLAEGAGRRTSNDRRRFYTMAMGSLEETRCLITLIGCEREVVALADKTGAHLYRLIQRPGGA
jgi:four helix bundle protein